MLSQRSRTILIYFQDSVEWKSPVDFSMRLGESHRKINDPWIHFKTKSKLRRDSSFFQFGWRELGKSYHNGLIIFMKLCVWLTEDRRSTSVFSLYWQLSQGQMADFPAFIASRSFDLWNHHKPQIKWYNLWHILMY